MKFKTVLIDPPWRFETHSEKGKGRSPERHYQTMTDQELRTVEGWTCIGNEITGNDIQVDIDRLAKE